MKVLLVSPGNSIHTLRWAHSLAEKGVDIGIASMQDASPDLSVDIPFFKLEYPPPHGSFLNAARLRKVLRVFQPDLLHAHYASSSGTLATLSGFHPRVISVWGSDVFKFPEQAKWKKLLIQQTLKRADWVCSTSEVMEKRVRDLCPNVKGITITPFGIDLEKFSITNSIIKRDTLTIGTVKTLKPVYGIDTLIQGFAICLRKLQAVRSAMAEKLHLRIVGGGPLMNDLKQLAQDLKISERTEFTGAVSHNLIPQELRKLDVYVAVSREESFGVAVLEASACGCPVIVSNVGGLPEVVRDGVTGLVVPSDDPESLAMGMIRMIENPQMRERLGRQGRQRVREKYDWTESVDQMLRLYELVLNNKINSSLRSCHNKS